MASPPNLHFQTEINKNCSPLVAKVVVDEFNLSQRVHSTKLYKLSKRKPNHFQNAYVILMKPIIYILLNHVSKKA